MTLADWGTIALIVIAVVNLLLLGGLVYLVFMVRNQMRQLQEQAQPVISEVRSAVAMVKDVASDVGQRVETISERAEHLATEVTARAEQITADVTQRVEHVTADATQRVEHVTAGATRAFDQVANDLTQRVEHVIDLTDRLADRIVERVDTTTSVIEEAVTRPMISLASVRAGVHRGLEVWRGFRERGDGRREEQPAMDEHERARRMIEAAEPATSPARPPEG